MLRSISVAVLACAQACCVLYVLSASRTDSSGCLMTFMQPRYGHVDIGPNSKLAYTFQPYTEGSAQVVAGVSAQTRVSAVCP
jgi:hypothetical protein